MRSKQIYKKLYNTQTVEGSEEDAKAAITHLDPTQPAQFDLTYPCHGIQTLPSID